MTKGEKIVSVASAEVGYSEEGNSNRTKYGKWFGFDGVPWCGIFVSWCYAMSGYQLPKIGFTKGFAGCQTAVAYFKKYNLVVTDPQPGDIVFFDWNADGRYDHTGIFVEWKSKATGEFFTIEGNTSINNQSNGGMVMKRTRNTKVSIFVRA